MRSRARTGTARITTWNHLSGKEYLLDVRSPAEFKKGSVPGAVNIPLDELQRRIAEIPAEGAIAIFCLTGTRSCKACGILLQNGFTAYNVSGGYTLYRRMKEAGMLDY